jgi:hypothetical protein
VEDQEQLHSLLRSYNDLLAEKPRLTLEDLQLTQQEKLVLKSCDKAFRSALWKSGEHACLTSYPECCRKTAINIREYQRTLTLSENNKIPNLDSTPLDMAQERSKQFFSKRNVPNT